MPKRDNYIDTYVEDVAVTLVVLAGKVLVLVRVEVVLTTTVVVLG